MSKQYLLQESMTLAECDPGSAAECCLPVVEVISEEEFDGHDIPAAGKEAIDALLLAESNYCEVFSDYIVGSLAVVNKVSEDADPDLFAYYVDDDRLIFVDNGGVAEKVLAQIAATGAMRATTTGHALYMFLKNLLMDDLRFLDKMEDDMEPLEEQMIDDTDAEISTKEIMVFRRTAMLLSDHYQQLSTMADILSDNENNLMSDDDARSFDRISSLADRLATRAEAVKEYSLQLQELWQTRLQIKQNTIMQTFTIVTVIFAPLTLITGWFGMNLQDLPGLQVPFMYVILLVFGVLFTIAAIIFLRKKHWV